MRFTIMLGSYWIAKAIMWSVSGDLDMVLWAQILLGFLAVIDIVEFVKNLIYKGRKQ